MEQTKQYEYVDLGLPSGLKWAKCNVGAKTETGYGYCFQWGDIEDKTNSDCGWESYKYGDGSNFSKYNTGNNGYGGTIDNKTTLDIEDDAAAQIMGSDWRMPTQDELQELADNTDNEWICNYNGTGVNGRKFTSKTDTSKYIFIPASGIRSNSSFFFQGSYGAVWSSSLNADYSGYAWFLYIGSCNVVARLNISRSRGFMVRGVTECR